MEDTSRNIYKTARTNAGYTQEKWAALIGTSTDSVRAYEAGRWMPPDEIVERMADIAGMPILAYWYLKEKSAVGNDLLPDVERMDLPKAVVQLLVAIRNFKSDEPDLLDIAADGVIDSNEHGRFAEICESLDDIVRASLQVKLAERSVPDGRNTG